jgi:hypothetical protein
MPLAVVTGAQIVCSFGMSPGVFTAMPTTRTTVAGRPVGTITDIAPMANIGSFGMCMSLSNPSVAAATSAALGVLTPMPCMPTPVRPWTPAAPTTLVGGLPVLATGCTTQCAWAGVIQVASPGQGTAQAK